MSSGKSVLEKRYDKTISFLKEAVPPPAKIFDLGTRNPLSILMEENGYEVINTKGEDLDLQPDSVRKYEADLVTAFEIFEHLVAPFNVLRELPAEKLVASVPLKLWFAKAYRNPNDPWDNHYHEFESWQFDWLLDKAGWKIERRIQWAAPTGQIGIRPLLRKFTPRYYAVYAIRK